jgi:hypothetical protein
MGECQAQPEAWSDWGGFVDTHEKTNSKSSFHFKTAYKKEKETKNLINVSIKQMQINLDKREYHKVCNGHNW